MNNECVQPKLWLLGQIRVDAGGGSAHLPSGKPAALLAFLWLNPGTRWSREHLCELFWSHLEADSARANLRTALSQLRKVHGLAEIIDVRHSTISVEVALASDVTAFEAAYRRAEMSTGKEAVAALESAAAMATGEFMPGLENDWVCGVRTRLRGLALTVFCRLGGAAEAEGDNVRAKGWYERAVQADPLDESGHAGVMRVTAADGRHPAAIDVYRRYAKHLKRAVGLAPSDAMQRLAARIRSGEAPRVDAAPGNAGFAAVLDWLNRHQPERALELLSASGDYWRATGRLPEIVQATYAALDRTTGESPQRANVLRLAGVCHTYEGDYQRADLRLCEAAEMMRRLGLNELLVRTWIDLGYCRREYLGDAAGQPVAMEAVEMARQAKDHVGEQRARVLLAGTLWHLGHLEEARREYETVLQSLRQGTDQESLAITLANLTILTAQIRDVAAAGRYAREAKSHATTIGLYRALWGVHYGLVFLNVLTSDPKEAAAHAREAALMGYRMGNSRMCIISLEALAMAEVARKQFARAVELVRAAHALRANIGLAVSTAERRILDGVESQIKAAEPHLLIQVAKTERIQTLRDALVLLPD